MTGLDEAAGRRVGGQALLGGHGVSLAAPNAARAVLGAALFLTVTGLFGLELGFVTRRTAGGIAAVVGIDLVLQDLAVVLPANWRRGPSSLVRQVGEQRVHGWCPRTGRAATRIPDPPTCRGSF